MQRMYFQREIKEPKIDVNISKDEEFVYCEISDNAGGVKEEFLEKVFEPYFTTKESSGTGIGLYIAREIIEKHMYGTIGVKNGEKGSIFSISIPIHKKDTK